jgi:flagellar basal body-associated protein FliL
MRKGVLWIMLVLLGIVLAIGTALVLRVTSLIPELSNQSSPTIVASPSSNAVSPNVAELPKTELPTAPFPEISDQARLA